MQKVFLLYSWSTGLSGNRLARVLGLRRQREHGRHDGPPNRRRFQVDGVPDDVTHLIRWGSSGFPYTDGRLDRDNILNPVVALNLARNKLRTRLTLQERDILVPETTTDYYIALSWVNEGFPVVWRPEYHRHGDGFTLMDPHEANPTPLPRNRGGYYAKYVDKREEYRVHVLRRRILYVQEKAAPNRHVRDTAKVWNRDNGFTFHCLTGWGNHPHRQQFSVARRAVQAVGLDFGGVDLLIGKDDGRAYVCEINSAPALRDDFTRDKYADAFRVWLEETE